MEDDIKKVEAVLFTTGRFLTLDEISKLSGIASVGYLKDILNKLKEQYDSRDSSICIIQQGETWKLGLKKEYLQVTEKLLTDCELDRPTQETLAVIAYKTPVLQSDIVKIRGNTCYDHVKMLLELGFITSEKSGRTRILKVTPKFYDYFDVVEDQLRAKLDEGLKKQQDATQ